jgi:hypothetical protein
MIRITSEVTGIEVDLESRDRDPSDVDFYEREFGLRP